MSSSTDAGRVAALVGLLFGLAGMGSAAVAATLPAIAADLDLSTGGASWVISLYALMLAVATAVYGPRRTRLDAGCGSAWRSSRAP